MRILGYIVGWLAVALGGAMLTLGALIQHIITCIKHEMVFTLVLGILFFPVGILHGWGIWLGLFAR